MPLAGQNHTAVLTTALPPDEVIPTLLAGLTGATECTVTLAGPSTVVVTRRYTPTWLLFIGACALFFFLLGLLVLLIKNTETLTITVVKEKRGSRPTAPRLGRRQPGRAQPPERGHRGPPAPPGPGGGGEVGLARPPEG
jgi:hypothetical protein